MLIVKCVGPCDFSGPAGEVAGAILSARKEPADLAVRNARARARHTKKARTETAGITREVERRVEDGSGWRQDQARNRAESPF